MLLFAITVPRQTLRWQDGLQQPLNSWGGCRAQTTMSQHQRNHPLVRDTAQSLWLLRVTFRGSLVTGLELFSPSAAGVTYAECGELLRHCLLTRLKCVFLQTYVLTKCCLLQFCLSAVAWCDGVKCRLSPQRCHLWFAGRKESKIVAASQKRPPVNCSWSGMPRKEIPPRGMSQCWMMPLYFAPHTRTYVSKSRNNSTSALCMLGAPQLSVPWHASKFWGEFSLAWRNKQVPLDQALICDCLLKETCYAVGVLGVSEIFRCGSE